MKSHLSGLLLTALIFCLVATPVEAACPAADIYVDDNCDAGGGSGTESDPYCLIQAAWLDAAAFSTPADPATICVMPGTYAECVSASGDLLAIPGDVPTLILADAFDPANPETSAALTTIDGTACADVPAIFIGGTGATLDGFRIMNGAQGGVYGQGGVVITNNLITGNTTAIVGGGVYLYPGSCFYGGGDVNASLSDNIIRGNSAADPTTDGGDGGGVFVWARESLDFAAGPCGNTTVTISGNKIEDNTISNTGLGDEFIFPTEGGGLYILTDSLDDGNVSVVVTQNTITGNSAFENTSGYGGGIWASTGGAGEETIEISENRVEGNTITSDGAGVSAWIQNVATGNHSVVVRDNDVIGNLAGANGGGLDLFVFAADLGADASYSLEAISNLVDSNACAVDGGGIIASITSEQSTDDAVTFPGHTPLAQEMTLSIRSNTITGNTAGVGGGGVILLPFADSDPTGTEFLPFCGTHLPTTAHIGLSNNLVAANHAQATNDNVPVIGGGILAFPSSVGEALASVSIDHTTVASNTINRFFVGGIEMEVDTREDCCATTGANPCPGYPGARGDAVVEINYSIVANNDNSGIGGPEPEPGLDNLTATVIGSYSYGHDNPPSENFESTIFDGTPAGSFTTDPELNDAFAPDACSTVFDDGGGLCDYNPALACTTSFDCMTCNADSDQPPNTPCTLGGGECTGPPEAECERVSRCNVAGHVTSPDLGRDGARDGLVNGIDLLRLALAFGSRLNEPPAIPPDDLFDTEADLDGDGIVDGDDLMNLASEFGGVCP